MSSFNEFQQGGRYGMHSGSAHFKHMKIDQLLIVSGAQVTPATPGVIWHVDGNKSASGNGKSWDTAFLTIAEAHTAATSARGDIILIAPKTSGSGRYNENVLITKESLTIMGVGGGKYNPAIRASGATTKIPFTGEIEGTTISGCGLIICAKNTTVCNMAFDGSGAYVGIYIGDGYRLDTSYDYDPEYCRIYNCFFKYGVAGIYADGCSCGLEVSGCYFYNQSDEGIMITPGGLQSSRRMWIHDNCFQGCEDYGIRAWSHALVKELVIGPNNIFMDQLDGTTEMTNPVLLGASAGTCGYVGNFECTDTECSGGTDNYMAGNTRKVGTMGTPFYITEADSGSNA
ncbi:MAG: hypothetical protein E3J56_01025 [Candidatus Aminicenantes bacterium]|nr:MAG: hypothetical protein E3J56_01025 [Candidatus Aminicenantes bacterium]